LVAPAVFYAANDALSAAVFADILVRIALNAVLLLLLIRTRVRAVRRVLRGRNRRRTEDQFLGASLEAVVFSPGYGTSTHARGSCSAAVQEKEITAKS
jgi:hypothetical protein